MEIQPSIRTSVRPFPSHFDTDGKKSDAEVPDIEYEIKQVMSDSTAGLAYSKGVSIVHLSMLMGNLYVTRPNLLFGDRYDDSVSTNYCNTFARKIDWGINTCIVSHLFCMVANFGSEIFETDVTTFGTLIKTADISAVLLNLGISILSMILFF